MPTAPDPSVFALLVTIMVLGAYALWRIPDSTCRCPQCSFHAKERAEQAEQKRAKNHRTMHMYWNLPWGDDSCAACRAGHQDDRTKR